MASVKMMETKTGKQFYKISVSRGHGISPYTMRWYVPEGHSKKTIERELRKTVAEFELQCSQGLVLTRTQKKEQEKKAEQERAKLRTVRQYADGVFMPTKETYFSENARSSYRMCLDKHILPHIGNMLMIEVTPAIVTKLLIDYQKQGYSHASSIKLYNVLKGLFDMAFMDDSIPISPMLKVKRPVPRKDECNKTEQDKAYTLQELRYVQDCMAKESLKWRTFVSLSIDTWARRGEICGVQWADIDFRNCTITIRRNLQYTPDRGVYVTNPKNGRTRVIDIGNETIELLKDLRAEQATKCISKWVFSQEGASEPIHPQSPTRYFKRLEKKYGLVDFHPHKLRHSGASGAITNGADIVSVSERMGHSDTSVTLRMYAHANEESIRRAGETVRSILRA